MWRYVDVNMRKMKFNLITLLILTLCVFAISCTSKKEKLSKDIYILETSDSSSSQAGMSILADKYYEFYKNFPQDSISEIYLYKAFMYKYLTADFNSALSFSTKYSSSYGKTENFYNICLKKADIFNSALKNIDSAVYYYLKCEDKIQFSSNEYRNAAQTIEKWVNSNKNIDTLIIANTLFSAAKFYHLCTDFEKAAKLYSDIAMQFENYTKSPQALSSSAFIFWNELKNTSKAKEIYQILINKFPESTAANEAKVILNENMLEMTDEQLAEYLLNKNK